MRGKAIRYEGIMDPDGKLARNAVQKGQLTESNKSGEVDTEHTSMKIQYNVANWPGRWLMRNSSTSLESPLNLSTSICASVLYEVVKFCDMFVKDGRL
jgi:hypothetical protein